MEIEETVERQTYLGFDLVHLRHGKSENSRWQITKREAGMNRGFGYTSSVEEARVKIDKLLREAGASRR